MTDSLMLKHLRSENGQLLCSCGGSFPNTADGVLRAKSHLYSVQHDERDDRTKADREVSVAFPELTLGNLSGAVEAMRRQGVPWDALLALTVHPGGVTQFVYTEKADHGAR